MVLLLVLVFVSLCQLLITVSDYVTKTESKTGSETKISNDSNTMDGKTESTRIWKPEARSQKLVITSDGFGSPLILS